MALAVAKAIRDNTILVAEAGTGTGKTFAYLVPALINGGKVIISTVCVFDREQCFQLKMLKQHPAHTKQKYLIILLK